MHTGEKRYECSTCKKMFTTRYGVKLHTRTVHLKIPYEPWINNNKKRRLKRQLLAKMDEETAEELTKEDVEED